MYCGSCLRDNALAAELIARGHDVTLLPLYTPTLTDEPNVSSRRVLFGGISIYLQQKLPLFRRTPRLLERVLDSPAIIRFFASRSSSTDPRTLGELTIAMLDGADGVLKREFDKLIAWLADDPPPDVVNLPNSMLIALARPLARALDRPVCCTLQGEELFLDGLTEPYRERAYALIRAQTAHVDRFVAVSDFCAASMADRLRIAPDRIAVVPLGVNADRFARHNPSDGIFRVGYMGRIAPEKGLHALADAYTRFRRRVTVARASLEAAGYLDASFKPYLDDVRRALRKAGLDGEFTYHGAVDGAGKAAFLGRLDLMSMPATYDEPKGLPLLEAMACGVPVLQPRRGAFIETVERTGGGLLVDPEAPEALAEGLERLYRETALREALGRRGYEGVRSHYTVQSSTDRLLRVYETVVAGRERLRTSDAGVS